MDIIPNHQKMYTKIATLISNARLAGELDWDVIVDRARVPHIPQSWDSPVELLQRAHDAFRLNPWDEQPVHLEVMCEKQALEGLFIPICDQFMVPYISNKGYCSQTVLFRKGIEASVRFDQETKRTIILYFGDHDPSGLDMDRDLESRLRMFSLGSPVEVRRLSLTWKQIKEFNPPPNPAKLTDSRASEYIRRYGGSSWELDAMGPQYLQNLLAQSIIEFIDKDLWNKTKDREEEMRVKLAKTVESFE